MVTIGSGTYNKFDIGEYVSASRAPGTPIGTAGGYRNHGTTIVNAVEHNNTTFFDGPDPTGDRVGLDLDFSEVVPRVQFTPSRYSVARMVGGLFQASDMADFSSGVVTPGKITATPPDQTTAVRFNNATAYRYYRHLSPANGH